MASQNSSRLVVYAALVGNLLVAVTKVGAAMWTGSSAMLSEAIHSFVDTGNQAVLLYGIHRAARPPDDLHPFGHGRELYFWSFIVALLMFTIGAGVTFYEGVLHILSPHPISDAKVNYIVLGCSAVFEGGSWIVAWREFSAQAGDRGVFTAMRRSKNPPAFIVLFEDSAALIGLFIAFAGTFAAERLQMPVLDGVASIGIAILLGAVALLLARESKDLLIGEPAKRATRESMLRLARNIDGIEGAELLFTVHLGPDQIVAALSLDFVDTLTAPQIERLVITLETIVHEKHPEVLAIFIKPQTLGPHSSARLLIERRVDDEQGAMSVAGGGRSRFVEP